MSYTNPAQAAANKYLYNGKELQDDLGLDWYDYGTRYFDPVLARFHSTDLLAETFSYQSPYAYAVNNPIRFIDKNGMGPDDNSEDTFFKSKKLNELTGGHWSDKYKSGGEDEGSDEESDNSNSSFSDFTTNNSSSENGSKFSNENGGESSNEKDPPYWAKMLATFLRNSKTLPIFGIGPAKHNPFYGAVAISGDLGILISGSEGDVGGYFVLAGKKAGQIIPYTELASGVAPEANLGAELARIDYTGNPNNFSPNAHLFGVRNKIWFGIGISYWGGSYSYAWSNVDRGKNQIRAVAASLSFGASLWIFSGGHNKGIIE